jgi:hypothetical protein
MMFLKDLFTDLFSSSYTSLHSVLSYLVHLQIVISMGMILNFSYHSLQLTLQTISLTSNKSLPKFSLALKSAMFSIDAVRNEEKLKITILIKNLEPT